MARRSSRAPLRTSHSVICYSGKNIRDFLDPMVLDKDWDAAETLPEEEALEIVSRLRGGDDE